MNWLWLAVVGIVTGIIAFIAGLFAGVRNTLSSIQPTIQQLNRNMATDRDFMLRVLRRELANWMLQRDPDRYLRIYKEAHEENKALSIADHNEKLALLTKLSQQYPFYKDFDLVGTREHVLYADAWCSYDEVERHFRDIIRFQALQIILDENWSGFRATSDNDLAHLEKYVEQYKDALFKRRLKDAVHDFEIYRHVKEGGFGEKYETATFSVCPVSHVPEIRWGFHFKDTDEYGLYTIFVDDNDKCYTGFYRSNAGFDDKRILMKSGLE